jgi:hypothetical protein
MKSDLLKFKSNSIDLAVQSSKECNAVLNQNTSEVDKSELLNILLDSIESVKINEKSIFIKLNKDIIINGSNIAMVADGLNIQIGKRVELNPDLNFWKSKWK